MYPLSYCNFFYTQKVLKISCHVSIVNLYTNELNQISNILSDQTLETTKRFKQESFDGLETLT